MHENGQMSTDGAIRVSVSLEHERADRIRLDCTRDGSVVAIRLTSAAALDLIEDLRGARQQMIRPGADNAGNVVARVGSMREVENVVAQANVIREPVESPGFLFEMAEVFDVVANKQGGRGHGATTTLRQLAAACRVRDIRGSSLKNAHTTDS